MSPSAKEKGPDAAIRLIEPIRCPDPEGGFL